VLAAVVLGLSGSGPGFRMSFPRVVLGQIAVQDPALPAELPAAMTKMSERLEDKLRKEPLEAFIEDTAEIVEALLADTVPGVNTAKAMARIAAKRLTSGLRKNPLRSRLWRTAAEWYVETQPAMADYLEALVTLNWTAHKTGAEALLSVDDKLMKALLADLRSSFSGIKVRLADAVVLLDDGDTPTAKAFIESFLRVKRMSAPQLAELLEPLTLVTVSGGGLLRDIRLDPAEIKVMAEGEVFDDIPMSDMRDRLILRVPSAGLLVSEVRAMAMSFRWPAGSSEDTVSAVVHELTDGHPYATDLLLRELVHRPDRINDLDAVLRGNRLDGKATEQHILERIVKSFSPHGAYHSPLREILVTLAAGRDQAEAETLCSSPLFHPNEEDKDMLLGLSTLWTHPGHGESPRLHPFVRYLCLRSLARRDGHHRASWHRTFKKLRDAADGVGDVDGRMHHDLMLVADQLGAEPVATELTEQLPSMSSEEWCHRLDLVIATPNPYRISRVDALIGDTPVTEESRPGSVARLLGIKNALNDPCLTDKRTRGALHSLAAADYLKLADQSRNRLTMIRRSELHRAEARKLR
jgi:hypothetical protein